MVSTLQGVKGVMTVKPMPMDDGIAGFELRTAEDRDMREEISHAIGVKGWPIRRLERKSRRLADAFFDILRVEDPLKETPDAAAPGPKEAIKK
jgi:hypothetical protein